MSRPLLAAQRPSHRLCYVNTTVTPDDKSLPPKDAGAAASAGEPAKTKKSRPLITEDEGIIHGETANYPRVVFVTAKDSPECDKVLARLRSAGGDFENLRAAGWKIGETADNDIQIVDRDLIPELAQKLSIHEYPAVACIDKGKVVRSFKSGCTTPLDVWTFGWLAKGIDERPAAPVLEAARVATTGSYPLRGNHWSVNGDWNPTKDEVVAHLRGPNHASRNSRQPAHRRMVARRTPLAARRLARKRARLQPVRKPRLLEQRRV